MKLEIVKAGINGEGIAFFKRKPVFIEGCFPDEVVDADLIDEGRHYKGRLKAVLKKSPERIKPVCSYADKCGACALMGLKYDGQLAIKMQLLENALYKYTRVRSKASSGAMMFTDTATSATCRSSTTTVSWSTPCTSRVPIIPV